MKIIINQQLQEKLKLLVFEVKGINNTERDEHLWEKIETLVNEYKQKFADFSACKSILQPARKLYKAVGIEPSRYRPASEALIKRVLKGKELYQVNTIVDFGNYCSLQFMTPVGLYDLDKIIFPVEARIGKDDEIYEGLGKPEVFLHDKLVLADEAGAFGNPSSDSTRTSISLDTNNILFVYYNHKEINNDMIEKMKLETDNLFHTIFSPSKIVSDLINFND
ncbi:MAG: hypothetical protein KAR38_15970 [Calditrichia bacterium]|nr:hypothetical protein [Calditrichia bacterium]